MRAAFLRGLVVAFGVCVFANEPRARAGDCKPPVADADRDGCVMQLNKEITDATVKKTEAQRVYDEARNALLAAPTSGSAAAQVKVDAAKKEINRLEDLRKGAQATLDELLRPPVKAVASPPRDTAICWRELVVCYDRDGNLYAGDVLPSRVHVGDKLTVIVFTTSQTLAEDRAAISVTFQGRQSSEHLFAVDPERQALGAPAPNPIELLSYISDAVADDTADFVIAFSHPNITDSIGVSWTEAIHVDLGYSYYSVALLIAATYKGDRRVLRDLSTVADHAVDPGFALNIFPGGRERGIIGYARRGEGLRRWLANNVGFQLGTDLDLTKPVDKLYAGLVFEPVAGLALVGGVTLRKVAVVPQTGALPAIEQMDASSPSEQRYVVRGYVGMTITLDLLKTISSIGTSIRGVALP